ncbi:Uncharacterised protein [Segatella copri]|nr:Uncharacterised protein [Segatella copri]
MNHVNIGKVEMYALHQHICSHEHLLVWIMHHGTIVAYTINCRLVFLFITFGEMVYKTEFT